MNLQNKNIWLYVIGSALVFPLFFQLEGGVYRDLQPMTDSLGMLSKVPLPISMLTFLALPWLFFLPGNPEKAKPALAMLLATVVVGIVSLWLGGDGVTPHWRKLTMLAQMAFPLGGLLLGQLIDDEEKIIARAFLVVVSFVVPFQLLATWAQGGLILTHYLYAFSIYSHFQYVTLILVCAFAYAVTTLWDEHKVWLSVLAIPMFIYITASLSFLTIFAYASLFLAFVGCKLWVHRASAIWVGLSVGLVVMAAFAGATYFGKMAGQRTSVEGDQGSFYGKFKGLAEGKIPLNVQERLDDWKFFGSGIVESRKTLLVGHPQPMPREIKSSPHNWYVDAAYTFGLVGLLPVLALIVYTTQLCWRQRRTLRQETWWLAAIVFYLVVIDSNFKVTLRQPYPGIFAYFLWGLLLTRLRLPPTTDRASVA